MLRYFLEMSTSFCLELETTGFSGILLRKKDNDLFFLASKAKMSSIVFLFLPRFLLGGFWRAACTGTSVVFTWASGVAFGTGAWSTDSAVSRDRDACFVGPLCPAWWDEIFFSWDELAILAAGRRVPFIFEYGRMGNFPLRGEGMIWMALLKMAGDRTVKLFWGCAGAGLGWHGLTAVLLSSGDFPGEPLMAVVGNCRLGRRPAAVGCSETSGGRSK